jgi:hypothetical protein
VLLGYGEFLIDTVVALALIVGGTILLGVVLYDFVRDLGQGPFSVVVLELLSFTGQGNASASACEGVVKPRVCRGRPLSSAAMASSAAWSNRRRSPLRGRYWRSRPLDAPMFVKWCSGGPRAP